jgi:hypothetical protein
VTPGPRRRHTPSGRAACGSAVVHELSIVAANNPVEVK